MPEKNCMWYKNITVEPSVSLYMLAFMMTSVFEQAFFIDKACRVNHGLSEDICNNLNKKENEEYNYKVQVTVSNFLQWESISANLMPLILVLFLGAWSDKYGRKLPLIVGLIGKLYYSILIVVNSLQPTWPVQYIIYTATLPTAISGADAVIFASAYSYLSDITTVSTRTFRITIFDACYLCTMPLSIALGRYLFVEVINKSYTLIFIINICIMSVAIIYSLIRLEWRTTPQQKSLKESEVGLLAGFFDIKHLMETLKCFKKRPNRISLLPFIFIMLFYRFQRDEKMYLYLFFTNKMNWDYNEYSTFKIVQTSAMVFMMICGIKLMSRMLKFPDAIIIMIGTMSHILSRIIFMIVNTQFLFYLAAAVGSLGLIVAPTFRSMVSKSISNAERGRVFSILSATEYSVGLYSGFLFSQLYNFTITTYPSSFFLITIITQLLIFLIIFGIYIIVPKKELIYREPVDQLTYTNIAENTPEAGKLMEEN